MNSDYEKQLEREVTRALRGLTELDAPGSIAREVMTRLEHRARERWYRHSWQTWPGWLQAVTLLVLVALFAGLCIAGYDFARTTAATAAVHRAGEWLSSLSAAANTILVLLNSFCLVLKKLGMPFLSCCLLIAGLGYVMCVGLGTMYMRLVFARK